MKKLTFREIDLMIYQAYPRHIAREAALKAIGKAATRMVKDRDAATPLDARRAIWTATTAYANSPAGRNPDRQYIPMPATWFNRGSYLDDPKEWEVLETLEVKPLTIAEKMKLDGF